MRVRLPVSRASFSIRLSRYDLICAAIAPWLALWVRQANVLYADIAGATTYCAIAFLAATVAFVTFRVRDGLTHLFSVDDALEVAKAVLLAEALACLVLFSATRLEGIPRSTPVIHALILGAALVSGRAFIRMFYKEAAAPTIAGHIEPTHALVIGSNKLSALYIQFLRAYGQQVVVGVLDDRPETLGRSTAGVKVLGTTSHLARLIEEYRDHGIHIDQIFVGCDPEQVSDELGNILRLANSQYHAEVGYIPELVGLRGQSARKDPVADGAAPEKFVTPRGYFAVKRYIDFTSALTLVVVLSPFFMLTAFLAVVDVGLPVFFWQRRIGMNGRSFQLHKFRTLKPSFDGKGLGNATRLSPVGRFLRSTRLDELPQLLNVLVGDMSIIGPRPLLPHDQPANPAVRLSVRPGITGWAQVNGGRLLDPETKNELDEWYVRNASFGLDFKILLRTAYVILRGERLNDVQTPEVKRGDYERPPEEFHIPAE